MATHLDAVELFSGIGGFRLALDASGHRTIWANDSSAKACRVYRDRFGAVELQEGDIHERLGEVPPHELLTAGFPCQPFSSAGKKAGIRDPRGTLFQAIVDVLSHRRPRLFVLENVKRLLTMENGVHFSTILTALGGVGYDIEWRLLNAMHFGLPQNRQRLFLLGTRRNRDSRMPGPPRIRLASSDDLLPLAKHRQGALSDPLSWQEVGAAPIRYGTWGIASEGRVATGDAEGFSDAAAAVPLKAVLEAAVPEAFDFTDATSKWIANNTAVNRFVGGVEILSNQAGGARMGYTIFGANGVAPTLTSTTSRHYERYRIGDRFRRLTNVEYARIQGFPDDHCRAVSIYDQYALFGNAVPPPMANWVVDKAVDTGFSASELPPAPRQRTLFDYAFGR